eukprot:CAMPEP_0183589370 /NCGR_PEP_ID=MMETSP0371-20130417/162592_1 /TAXON_ID=268820 /ORGANISM="Peridinium aciculiferum, Strain PAER-2" /LENGTH=534 /DNA_ID=CAMNT_0025800687 /DNA_START=8 /DNA_END=1612 /DNA_ORIENTATION=+
MVVAVRSATASRVFQLCLAAVSLAFVRHGEIPWPQLPDTSASPAPQTSYLRSVSDPLSAPQTAPEELAANLPHSPAIGGDTHEHSKSWQSTLTELVAGVLLFFMSMGVLWLNEGHAVRMDVLFSLAKRKLKMSAAAPADPENLRELVFVTGTTQTEDSLKLSAWANLQAPSGSAKLRASTQMYLWVEKEESKDNSTTYTYSQQWVDEYQDSNNFTHTMGHENPPAPVPFVALELAATTLGDFTMSQRMMGKLQAWKPCDVKGKLEDFQQISSLSAYQQGEITTFNDKESVFFRASFGGTPVSPSLGDLLTHFEYVPCGPTSVMGVQVEQAENRPTPWSLVPLEYNEHHSYTPMLTRANTGNTNLGDQMHQTLLGEAEKDEYFEDTHSPQERLKRGVAHFLEGFPNPFAMADAFMAAACPDHVLIVAEEKTTPESLMSAARKFERTLTMVMRLFGFMLMYAGIELFFSPLRKLLSYLWIFGTILKFGIDLFACACAVSCSSCTIAGAYAAYRPLYSLLILCVGAALVAGMYKLEQ